MKLSGKRYLFETDKEKDILTITKSYAQKRLELLKKLQSEGIKDLEQEIQELEVEIQGLNKELNDIPLKKIQEALSGIKSITGALSGLDGEIGEIFSSLGSAVDSISASFERAKSETKDYYGAISSAISGVVDKGTLNYLYFKYLNDRVNVGRAVLVEDDDIVGRKKAFHFVFRRSRGTSTISIKSMSKYPIQCISGDLTG